MLTSVVRPVLGIPICFECESETICEVISRIYPEKLTQCAYSGIRLSINHSKSDYHKTVIPAQFKVDDLTITGECGDSYFSADRKTLQGQAFLSQSLLDNEYLLRHQVIYTLCYFLLTYRHYLPLHATCFELEEFQILCFGASGVGKSTLAMAAYQNGLTVLSEDLCFVGESSVNGVMADCREFHLFSDSYCQLESANNISLTLTHNGKLKHIVPNRPKAHSNVTNHGNSANILLLFLIDPCLEEQTQINPILNTEYVKQLLRPSEEGFKLFSGIRNTAIEWLSDYPSFEVSIGTSFEHLFHSLKVIKDEILCVTP